MLLSLATLLRPEQPPTPFPTQIPDVAVGILLPLLIIIVTGFVIAWKYKALTLYTIPLGLAAAGFFIGAVAVSPSSMGLAFMGSIIGIIIGAVIVAIIIALRQTVSRKSRP